MAALILITLLSGAPMPTTLIDQAALSALVVARGVTGDALVELGGATFSAGESVFDQVMRTFVWARD